MKSINTDLKPDLRKGHIRQGVLMKPLDLKISAIDRKRSSQGGARSISVNNRTAESTLRKMKDEVLIDGLNPRKQQ